MKQSLGTTMRPEEVGFQINYSRNVLKGIIKQYPLKDVRKSIEHVLHKVFPLDSLVYSIVCILYISIKYTVYTFTITRIALTYIIGIL